MLIKAPKGKSGGQEDTEVKRGSNHFCGRLTGKSHKDLYAMWGVTGNHSIYHDCRGPLAQLLSDPIQCSNLSLIELVLRYKLPIQLLQLAYVF